MKLTDKKTIDKIDNGEVIIFNKKAIQWTGVITIAIFVLSQVMVFGIWKGGVDEQIKTKARAEEVYELRNRIETIERIGSAVSIQTSHKVDVLILNQKRMAEKMGLQWQTLEVDK